MAITRPTVLPTWADTGDKTQPTNPEIETGWPVTSIPPSRQRFNWFFFWVSNAVRYFSRRGLSDWVLDETYEIGDRCQSSVDGKTYRSKVGANINFEPSVSPTKWERWGFTFDDLWTYLTTSLNGGTCPNTGPASAPTLLNQFTQYTGITTGEKWQWVGGAWCVTGKLFGVTSISANVTHSTPGEVAAFSFTAHRAGRIIVTMHNYMVATASAQASGAVISLNGTVLAGATMTSSVTGQALRSAPNGAFNISAGDIIEWRSYSGYAPVTTQQIVCGAQYTS